MYSEPQPSWFATPLTHVETTTENSFSVTFQINDDSEVGSYEVRQYLQNKDGLVHSSNSFFVHFFTATIAQVWDMPTDINYFNDGSGSNT